MSREGAMRTVVGGMISLLLRPSKIKSEYFGNKRLLFDQVQVQGWQPGEKMSTRLRCGLISPSPIEALGSCCRR